MNFKDYIIILVGQTAIFSIVAVILYRQLRSRLENKIGRALTLSAKQPRRLAMQVIINTLPKVGSTTIHYMLKAVFPQATLEKSQFLSYEGELAVAQDIEHMSGGSLKAALVERIPRMRAVRQDLDELLTSTDPHKDRVYFICGTREPLSWALSTLFQLLGAGHLPADLGHPNNAQRIIMDWFSGRPILNWLPSPSDWMLREIEGYLGVNPMGGGFDPKQGYQIMETKRGRLLLVRLESFDKCLPAALAELLSVPASLFKILRANVANDKKIARQYQELTKTLKFPRSFVESVYSDPYAVTFYSPEERRAFAERWTE
jgi:hypothetical protein